MSKLNLPKGNCPKCEGEGHIRAVAIEPTGLPLSIAVIDRGIAPCEHCGGTGDVDTSRRLALMKLDDGAFLHAWPAFPGETTIVDIRRTDEDMRREAFTLMIRSTDLPVVPEGHRLPTVRPEFLKEDGRVRFVDWGYQEPPKPPKPPDAEELTRILRAPVEARV